MLDVYRLLTMISERFDEIALYFMRGDDCSARMREHCIPARAQATSNEK